MNDLILVGNIGCGKSTLGKRLEKAGYTFIDEPIADWEYLLNRIYEKKEYHLIPFFQMRVLEYYSAVSEKLMKMQDGKEGEGKGERKPVVVTRSPRVTLLFVDANREHLSDEFYKSLQGYVELIESVCPFWKTARTVYLYQNAHRCFLNMNNRGGVEKNTVSLDYLRKLEVLHDQYAKEYSWDFEPAYDLETAFEALKMR